VSWVSVKKGKGSDLRRYDAIAGGRYDAAVAPAAFIVLTTVWGAAETPELADCPADLETSAVV
jgi:hypothetical protein